MLGDMLRCSLWGQVQTTNHIGNTAAFGSRRAGGTVAAAVLTYRDLDGHVLAPSYEQ